MLIMESTIQIMLDKYPKITRAVYSAFTIRAELATSIRKHAAESSNYIAVRIVIFTISHDSIHGESCTQCDGLHFLTIVEHL